MRKIIKRFIEVCEAELDLMEPICEFGSFQVQGQEKLADMRSLFKEKEYFGSDMRIGKGVDVLLDLHKIGAHNKSIGTVLMLDTIEHVEFPRKAILNLYNTLKPNGILIMSSVMNFPIHNHPFDYWRFTPEAFKSLTKMFNTSYVDYIGKKEFPHTVLCIAGREKIQEKAIRKIQNIVQGFRNHENMKTPEKPMKRILRKFTPPIIVDWYHKAKDEQPNKG